jgi:hypothetical protein
MADIQLAAPQFGVRLWRFQTGQYQLPDGRWVRSGFPGAADLWGIRVTDGRFVAVEVKSETGKAKENQVRFIEMIRRSGGVAGICRSVEDFISLVA